jgi:hypothetical protein
MAAVTYPQPLGLLRPSSALRWVNCAGSHALEGLYPEDEDSPEAREGTAAHYYATEALEGRVHAVGTLAPNGHPIDAYMVEGAQHWIDDVRAELPNLPGAQFRVETKVYAHSLIHPENEGTPDAWALSLQARRLIVWDYKYGHRYVDPFMFWQGINYVAGIFEGNSLTLADVTGLRVSIRVIQPRNYHPSGVVRVWETTGEYLWSLIEFMRARALEAKRPAAPTQTGPHCRDCRGRHACPAFAAVAARSMDCAGETVPMELPIDALGRELTRLQIAADRIKARISGLEEIAIAAIRNGKDVPGWRMGFVDSRERWAKDVAEVYALGDALGVDLRDNKPVTPAQAKTKFKAAGLPLEVLQAYYEKPTGAAKLSPADPNAAAKAFGG